MSTAYDDALAAARELSNPEGRRGYKRTSALAAVVAAQIGNELQPIVTMLDEAQRGVALGPEDAQEAAARIATLCRVLVGAK